MKKALLIKPKDSYSYAITPNLGLGYLASSLRNNGFEPVILDCNKESIDVKDFEQFLKRKDGFHLIGFQLFTNALPRTKNMIEISKRILKEAIIVVGGPHPSGDPEHTLNYFLDIDCIVIGEGETAITDIMKLSKKDIKNSHVLSNIKNVAFKNTKGQIVINKTVFIDNLDDIPFPAWDLINPGTYPVSPHGTFARAHPVAPIITSRGCPFMCTFCAGFKVSGRKIRRRSAENVINEIEFLYEKYNVREFHIEDDNFTFEKDYVIKLTNGVINKELNIWWACPNGIRLDKIDEEILSLMQKSGCYSIAVGVESGSDRILKKMRKNLTVNEIENKIALVKSTTNINITGFFLIGYPGETEEDIEKTLDLSKRLRIDKASFAPVMPLPGSEIYYEWKKKIDVHRINWDIFLYYQIVPFLSSINKRKLEKYLKKAMIEFYARLSIILGILKEIKTLYQLKVLLKRIKTILFR